MANLPHEWSDLAYGAGFYSELGVHLERSSGSREVAVLEAFPDSTLAEALAYHESGFAVLPLRGKQPASDLIRRTHGTPSTGSLAQRGATEEEIRYWFADPRVNVGIFCGEPSHGLVVLDFDSEQLPATAHLPLTPTVKTGRGLHYYYRQVSAVANRSYAWGEVRAQAPQYVVAPPSIHPGTGLPYHWLLPLDELEIADYAEVHLPSGGVYPKKHKTPTSPTEVLSTTESGDARPESWLKSFDRDAEAVAAMARALGIHANLGSTFHCILHEDTRPSAVLYQAAETKEWLYHDFHAPTNGGWEWLNLAQVRALKAGRTLPLSGPELATWKLILLVEAGLLELVSVPAATCASGLSPEAAHLYERFVFLLGCRWNYSPGAPAPLSRHFASALTGLSEAGARSAINELIQHQQIYLAGQQRRLRLWLPTGVELDVRTTK